MQRLRVGGGGGEVNQPNWWLWGKTESDANAGGQGQTVNTPTATVNSNMIEKQNQTAPVSTTSAKHPVSCYCSGRFYHLSVVKYGVSTPSSQQDGEKLPCHTDLSQTDIKLQGLHSICGHKTTHDDEFDSLHVDAVGAWRPGGRKQSGRWSC